MTKMLRNKNWKDFVQVKKKKEKFKIFLAGKLGVLLYFLQFQLLL